MPRLRSQSRSRSPHRRRRDDRSRSRSPSQRHRHHRDKDGRDQERDRERSRSRSPIRLPAGAGPISESDYFKKLDEFKIWLKDEKDRYFDQLSGEKARSYFRKFVKAWNKGRLSKSLYAGIDPAVGSASAQTSYKWSFASKSNKHDQAALQAVRDDINSATWGKSRKRDLEDVDESGSRRPSGRTQGPSMPSAADIAYAREYADNMAAEDRKYKNKKDKLEARDRLEDIVGPKAVGKEAQLEKRRAQRDNDRAFREEKESGGLEVDETTLMGTGDSFKDALRKRDGVKKRSEIIREEKASAFRERASVLKEKEKATMDMFQQLAKQRFG